MGGRGASGIGNMITFSTVEQIEAYFGNEDKYEHKGKWWAWYDSLSNDEKQGIRKYTSMEYRAINNYLRSGDLKNYERETMERYINGADTAIAKSDLKNDITVYRGIGRSLFGGYYTAEEIRNTFVGHTLTDKGYGSASPLSGSAYLKSYLLQIKVPKGKGRGAWVDPMSEYSGENEYMLARGTSYKITGAREENGRVIVEAEIVTKRGRK